MWAPPTEHSMTFLTAASMGSSETTQGMVLSPSHSSPPQLRRGTKRGLQTLVEWRQPREHMHSPKYSRTHTHRCSAPTGPKSHPVDRMSASSLGYSRPSSKYTCKQGCLLFHQITLSFSYQPALFKVCSMCLQRD